jgi:hypothetical protein
MTRPAYLGFPVQVLGREGLKSHDARRWHVALMQLRRDLVCHSPDLATVFGLEAAT